MIRQAAEGSPVIPPEQEIQIVLVAKAGPPRFNASLACLASCSKLVLHRVPKSLITQDKRNVARARGIQ
jgi:hypothetical protein